MYIERAPDNESLAVYGDDVIEIWPWPSLSGPLRLHMERGSISQLFFVPMIDGFYSAGYDGRVMHWTGDEQPKLLAEVNQRIEKFLVVNQGNDIILATVDGSLRRIERNGREHVLRTSQAHVTQIVSATNDNKLYVGYTDGNVIRIDITCWQQEVVLHANHPVRQIVAQGDVTAIAANGDTSYLKIGTVDPDGSPSHWTSLFARVSSFSLSNDLLIAVCSDGGIWMYSISHRKWLYQNTGGMNLSWTTTADDSKVAAAVDTEGHVVWLDLELARELLRS